ncbi:hypothetical protein [Nitrosomonas eutropha]|uniref:hypothetical protein n=1 Tax=Nitrosomonas eutropha TaxID=916 RepID=UPI0008ADEF7E|nr:hypothetical protein [Nitrosomonas eutropha]SEI45570.1 hypothetical protein SAMN05216318_10361 [Nitrosomonas eutropha]
MREKGYSGVDQDAAGGLTPLGRIVIDAWVFGILPESETCTGWNMSRMQVLYEEVYAAWEPYSHLPSLLPPELQQRHSVLYEQRIAITRNSGWDTDLSDES